MFNSNAARRESRPKAGFRGGQVGFVKKKVTFFRGQILAVYIIRLIIKCKFCADLFLDNLPPKCVPSTLLCYTWKMAYTQVESLHNFTAIYLPFDSNV